MKRIVLLVAIAAGVITTSCNSRANREMEMKLQAQDRTIEDMKLAMDRQHIIDSMAQVSLVQKEAEVAKAKTVAATYRAPRRTSSSAHRANSYAATRPVDNDNYQQQQQPQVIYQQPMEQQQPQKKGWSAKAKGAAIGAGVGAVGGALIGKRKGTGALIGAGIGALAGLGTGAIIDKRNGR